MAWNVEYTDDFGEWWDTLTEEEQEDVAFDPRRTAILLIGGKKTGNEKWYDKMIPIADKLFAEHLKILKRKEEDYG